MNKKYKTIQEFWDNNVPQIKEDNQAGRFYSSEGWHARQAEIDELKEYNADNDKERAALRAEIHQITKVSSLLLREKDEATIRQQVEIDDLKEALKWYKGVVTIYRPDLKEGDAIGGHCYKKDWME